MPEAPSMGHAAQVGAGAVSPVTEAYEFISCDIGKTGSLVESPGIRGSRSRIMESVNAGLITVGGSLVIDPRPDDLDNWLPRILGGTEAADSFPLAETVPEFYLTADKIAKVYEYDGCKVNRGIFRSAAGGNLQLTMEIEGKDETAGAAGSFPAISGTLSAMQPYIHHQVVLTLGSSPYECNNVEIIIDNALLLDRHNNSQTRTALPEGDRIITLSCDTPFTADEIALYDIALAGITGTAVWTNGTYVLTFTFANFKAPAEGPPITGKTQELPLRLVLQAYQSGATKELAVTNVSA